MAIDLDTMKKLLLWALPLTSTLTLAQEVHQLNPVTWPKSDKDTTYYTVKGQRQGYSFFRQYRHKEVQYEPMKQLTFDTYHTVDVMYHWYGD